MPKRREPDPPTAGSAKELAEILKVKRPTVYEWAKRGMPREPDGTYDVAKVQKWRAENLHRVLPRTGGPERQKGPREDDTDDDAGIGNGRVVDEDTRRTRRARAQLLELELQARQAQLFQVDVIEGWLAEVLTELRRALLGQGKHIAPLLLGVTTAAEIQAIIDKSNFAMLERLSRSDRMPWRSRRSE